MIAFTLLLRGDNFPLFSKPIKILACMSLYYKILIENVQWLEAFRIDECVEESDNRSNVIALCTNTIGSYKYTGNQNTVEMEAIVQLKL